MEWEQGRIYSGKATNNNSMIIVGEKSIIYNKSIFKLRFEYIDPNKLNINDYELLPVHYKTGQIFIRDLFSELYKNSVVWNG